MCPIDISIYQPQRGGLYQETVVVFDKDEIIVIVHPQNGNFHAVGTVQETVVVEGVIPGEYELSVILIPDRILLESLSDPVLLTRRSIEISPQIRARSQQVPDGSKIFTLQWATTSNDFILETSTDPFSTPWDLALPEPAASSPAGNRGVTFHDFGGNRFFRLKKTGDQDDVQPFTSGQ